MAHRDGDIFGGNLLQQSLDDKPAVLSGGSRNENHVRLPDLKV